MKKKITVLHRGVAAVLAALLASPAFASSHMDAPLITRDPSANTTDVYAFVQNENGVKVLVTALGVYPHQEPGIGPNKYNFDDNVLYEIHVATGSDVAAGKPTFSYQFKFETNFKNKDTVLQSYLGGDRQVVGVYATTSRRQVRIVKDDEDKEAGRWVQVARQGNPLFNEGLVAIADKDLYSRTSPSQDHSLFRKYAENPELCKLINLIVLKDAPFKAPESGRSDIAGIYIPDLLKVDLSTGPCRLAGGGPNHPTNKDDAGYSRLGIFGGDVLTSTIQPGFGGGAVPGGWPNGRRFGDDVVDIAVTALIGDLRVSPPVIPIVAGDGVDANDMAFNKVFPYESTPQNGRNHTHH